MMTYPMHVAGLVRDLPICKGTEDFYIGAFIMFGDAELTVACARDLLKLAEELDGLNTGDQFELLCRRFAKQNEEFNAMSVERLLGRLLADNSHTQVVENLGERLQSILHSEAFGYRWTSYCLVHVRLEDYESYMLSNCDEGSPADVRCGEPCL